MPGRSSPEPTLDFRRAAETLRDHWQVVTADAARKPTVVYIEDPHLREAIRSCINHDLVAYRFCLPTQLLGKLTNPSLDCLRLQKKKRDPSDVTGWDARTLGRKVIAPFNQEQECVLGTSNDPYVGNPMRIARMVRDDPDKLDVAGWNVLVDVLERVESRNDPDFTGAAFRQVLLEMFRRQQSLHFVYVLPLRVSLDEALGLARQFLEKKSGGERALALCGALFDAIGIHFGLYAKVNRARINASDDAIGQAADLECLDADGKVVLAVEVKDRTLTLADVEGTLRKSRGRAIREVFFTSPAVKAEDRSALDQRISKAFTADQNLYLFDFFDLARSVLALGGEAIRTTFLRKVGEHLDTWNTQPAHRQAWKNLLESV
jgi:hypothetical protein